MRVLIAGCGYVGSHLAGILVDNDHDVWGLRRSVRDPLPGVQHLQGDVTRPETLTGMPESLDAVVYAVSPSGRSEEAYREAYVDGLKNIARAAARGPRFHGRLVLVSSTGAYGHTEGEWVDEETPPEPTSGTGRRLVAAEEAARSLGSPGIALRLGGIYGPGRTRTIRRILSGEARCPAEGRYGNRIHRDDAARAVAYLLIHVPEPAGLYLGVDRDPAEMRDVYKWIAHRAGAPDPCASDDRETWEAEGRRGTNKRCSSDRLVASGYTFRYPTYREGYGPLVDELVREAHGG